VAVHAGELVRADCSRKGGVAAAVAHKRRESSDDGCTTREGALCATGGGGAEAATGAGAANGASIDSCQQRARRGARGSQHYRAAVHATRSVCALAAPGGRV
jgi:hypothetical protein